MPASKLMLVGSTLAAVGLLGLSGNARADGHDIVIVLDNSASMRRNDPEQIAKQAVRDFVRELGSNDRVAIVVFDAQARLAHELTYATPTSQPHILETLADVRYWGDHTNSAVAVERAIYHLKWDGRPEAQKSILLLTDGKIETGDAERDREMQQWLDEDLSQAALEADVRVFGIAFTEEANFRTIQPIARRTGGEYLRALTPADLPVVFERIARIMNAPPGAPEEVVDMHASELDSEAEEAAEDDAASRTSNGAAAGGGRLDGRVNPRVWLAAAVGSALLLALLISLLVRRRRMRERSAIPPEREAVLYDLKKETGVERHTLGKRTVIGRKPETEARKGPSTAIQVDRKQVSRQHAIIVYRADEYWIADAGTRNGTFVNDDRLQGERALRHGDIIRFESIEFEFRYCDLETDGDQTVFSDLVFDADGTVLNDRVGYQVDGDVIRSLSP